jgi:hypothetical protein
VCAVLPSAGGELEQIQFRLEHVSVHTTERYLGSKQKFREAVNDRIGIEPTSPCPDLVKTVPHVAFEVDDLAVAMAGYPVLIEPNSPSPGVNVAFIEVRGAPVELMQIDHEKRPDL